MTTNILRYAFTCALLLAAARVAAQDGGAIQDGASSPEQDKVRAKQMFEQGVSQYEAGQYSEALESFLEAYRLKPHPLVRVNIANCYDKLDRPVEAVSNFELFLDSGLGSAEQKSEIKEAVKNLKKRVGKLVLLVSPDATKITIDDTDQRVAPVKEPISLHAGRHKLVAELDGYETVERELEVKGDSSTELSLRLSRAAAVAPVASAPVVEPVAADAAGRSAAPPASETEPAPEASGETEAPSAPLESTASDEAPRKGVPSGVWVAGGFGVAFAIAGTITGVLAKKAEQNFNDNLHARFDSQLTATQQATAWSYANSASNRTIALAITTDALFASAIVSAGIATYLYFTRHKHDPSSETALVPTLTPTSAALTAYTTF